jgi:hypothetical protein
MKQVSHWIYTEWTWAARHNYFRHCVDAIDDLVCLAYS